MPNNNETTTKFKVDISELKKNFQEAQRQIRLANSEFKAATSKMDKWTDSADGITAKLKQLNDVLDSEKKKLKSLEDQYKLVSKQEGENSKGAEELKIKINNQKAAIGNTEKQIKNYNAKLDEMESESKDAKSATGNLDTSLKDVKDAAKKAGDGFTIMKGALANLVADGVRIAIDKIKDLGQAIVNVGKQSIDNYAEYEQLVGGVETLFGDSAKIVQKYADNAFKTAGMSANQYMSTVTSFSASLLQGLNGDTKKAAELADKALVDMSDNANKMGSDMTSIQNAYQGFAKQNYTMLDNLKLGYGGTQKEMARLINDSGVLGKKVKVTEKTVNDVSFDKIIEAIHKVQENMGITGTTAKEAASTIEGSKNSMQSAWQNLLTGLSDEDANVDGLFDNLVESIKTYGENLLPRIEALVKNATDFLKEKLKEYFPDAYKFISDAANFIKDDVLPIIKDIAGWLKDDILPIIMSIVGWIKDNLFPIVKDVINWVIDHKDLVLAFLVGIGAAFVAWKLASVITNIVKLAGAIKAMGAATAITTAKQWLLNSALLANPIAAVIAAIVGLVAAFVVLWKKSEAFRNFWKKLWAVIKAAAKAAWDAISGFFSKAWDGIKAIWNGAKAFFQGIWDGIKAVFSAVGSFFSDIFQGAWNGIKIIWNKAKTFFSDIWYWVKYPFVKAAEWFGNIFSNAWSAVKTVWNKVKTFFADIWDWIKKPFVKAGEWFGDKFGKVVKAIKKPFEKIGEFFKGIWDSIKAPFKTAGAKLTAEIEAKTGKKMATGGVVTKATNAIIGEAGKEAVVPLERNTGWLDEIANRLYNKMNSSKQFAVNGPQQTSITNNFYQTNNSPKALSRLEIYRQSKNLLRMKG